ncbi:MAG: aminopeptidase P family protein [Candidatus Bathyarchaeota archaeon]|nr:MAG: aminopeptidase P family protein [Candidatus Bathyarchaeota archaeon]
MAILRNRVSALKNLIEPKFDGYIATNPVNLLYLTELLGAADSLGAAAMLVPKDGESTLYIYGVNYEWAKAEAKNCTVELVKGNEELTKKVSEQIKSQKLKTLGFDTMTVKMNKKFSAALKGIAKLEDKPEYVWNLRKIKEKGEIEKIRKAAKLTVDGMQAAYDAIRPRISEYQVAAEIEYAMRKNGSYGVAFESSVASGSRSAYPHGGCGERRLESGDLVVVDIGARYKNYCADMTRTFVVGNSSTRQEKIHDVVKEAQERAFGGIKDGVRAADIDAIARTFIKKAGFEENFVHGLGHGIGLEVHERPTLNSLSKDLLRKGNVITDEPGIYILNFGGFRIEDTVLVKEGKAERLTRGLYV